MSDLLDTLRPRVVEPQGARLVPNMSRGDIRNDQQPHIEDIMTLREKIIEHIRTATRPVTIAELLLACPDVKHSSFISSRLYAMRADKILEAAGKIGHLQTWKLGVNAPAAPSTAAPVPATRQVFIDIGPTPRWALASDGAFVLLGTRIEIQRTAARALVDFVRTLDQGKA